jgi:hypothetical protein
LGPLGGERAMGGATPHRRTLGSSLFPSTGSSIPFRRFASIPPSDVQSTQQSSLPIAPSRTATAHCPLPCRTGRAIPALSSDHHVSPGALHGSLTTTALRRPFRPFRLCEKTCDRWTALPFGLISAIDSFETLLRHIAPPKPLRRLLPFAIIESPSLTLQDPNIPAFSPARSRPAEPKRYETTVCLLPSCAFLSLFFCGFDRFIVGHGLETWFTGPSPGMQVSCIMAHTLSATFLPPQPPPHSSSLHSSGTHLPRSSKHPSTCGKVVPCI